MRSRGPQLLKTSKKSLPKSADMATPNNRRKSVAQEPVTSVLADDQVPVGDFDSDDEVLAALGYKPEFKREFSLFTTFCVSFAVLGLLPSFASTLFFGMGYAGTAGMTWGWLIAMTGIFAVAASMAELASSMPTSGGLYYAAAVLAPKGWGPLASWITGWSNWMVQITGAPSVNYATSAMILAAASIQKPEFVPQNYQVFLLAVFIMIIHTFMSAMPTRWLASTNTFGSTFNFIALFVVIILIAAGTDRESRGLPKYTPSKEVWGDIYKGMDFPPGIRILSSFVAVIWTMSGYDAPFHLAEECSNASIAAPRAIVLTAGLGGIFGWFLQLIVAYTVVSIPDVLNSDLGQPYAAYLVQCLPQKIVITILSLTIIAGFFMGQGCMIAASRVTFAYSRDGCFPFSNYWAKVNTTTRTPVNAVLFNSGVGILQLFLIFGGTVTIGALFSVGALSSQIAFTTPIVVRTFFVGNRFRPGPWNLGKFGVPCGMLATAFVILMIPILNLPAVTGSDLTPALMNWTCLVYFGPMLFVMAWWFISARKWFKGPKVNIEHLMTVQGENVIDGQPDKVISDGESGSDTARVTKKD